MSSRLNRFLVSVEWLEHSLHLSQEALPNVGSNHIPILLCPFLLVLGPRPFRFELR